MKKLAVLVSLVCGLAVSASVLTPAAGADVYTDRCPFPVDANFFVHGNSSSAFNFPPSGPFAGILAGQLFVTITNLSQPTKSITVAASGPVFFLNDGSYLFKGAAFFALKSSATGDIPGPGLFLSHGQVHLTDSSGHVDTELLSGTVSGNLCNAVA